MRHWLKAWTYDRLTDPALPTILVIVAVIVLVMLAQLGIFGPALQWWLRPDAIQ